MRTTTTTYRQSEKALALLQTAIYNTFGIREEGLFLSTAYYQKAAVVVIKDKFDLLEIRFEPELNSWAIAAVHKLEPTFFSLNKQHIDFVSVDEISEKIQEAVEAGFMFW